MRNRLVIGLVAAGLLIVALTLTIGHHDREPRYRGQSLTVWLTNVHSSRIEDSEALSAIGTNAIPFLIKALAAKESLYAKCLRLYGSNLPALLLKRLPRGRTRMDAKVLKLCAIQALMTFGPRAESARSALLAALEDESPMDQLLILQTLLNLGPSAKSIPILVQTWRRAMIAEDPKASLSLRAFTAETLVTLLGQSAPLAPNAVVPALLEALDNPNQQLRLIALRYFKSPAVLTPEATVRLFALLTNADFDTRQGAFEALDSIGRTNQNLLPLVQAHLADRRTAVRATAARVLWKITGETSQSVAVLRTMVENQSGHRAAAHYLADMGAAAEPAVGSLNGLAHSDEVGWNDRILAAEAILKIEGPSDAAIRVLIDLLKAATAPADVRSVAEMLGKAGPAARSAIPALDQIAAQYKENRYLKQDLGRIKTVIEGNRPTGAR